MRKVVRTETRKRSGWGKLWVFLFVAFNLFCAWDVFNLSTKIDAARRTTSGLGHLALSAVANQRMNQLLAMWAAGAVILGIFVWLTRGKLEVTEVITDDGVPNAPPPPPGYR